MSPASARAAALRRAHRSARGSLSTARTTASGRALATASANAADPVHRSTTTGRCRPRSSSKPHSSSSSVSGRGTNTPGPTSTVTRPSAARPVKCCSGTRAARAATSSRNRAAVRALIEDTRTSLLRSTPNRCATNNSASVRGLGTPASASTCSASRRASRNG